MRIRPLLALFFASLPAGCSHSPVGANGDGVYLAVTATVDPGASLDAHLVNHSDAAVQVGWLPCYVMTDRRVGDRWSEIPRENQACILPVFTVERGDSLPFPLAAPATSGTFRLRTVVGVDSVFSAPFVVR